MLQRTILLIFATLLVLSSCKTKKPFIPSEEEVREVTRKFESKGQDLSPKQDEKMERLIGKVEDVRKDRIRDQQKSKEKGADGVKWLKKRLAKSMAKEYKYKKKIKKYHQKINLQRQSPEMRRKMKKRKKEANRKARKRMR